LPQILDLINRARGVLNEKYPRAYLDSPDQLLGWVVTGLQETHLRMKKRLNGAVPDLASPYWRHYIIETAVLAVSSGSVNLSLPSEFDILHSLVDEATDLPLRPFDINQEHILRRSTRLGTMRGHGYYALHRGIRVLLFPGAEGVPKGTRNLKMIYFRVCPRYPSKSSLTLTPDEYCEPAVNYAIAKGLAKHRDSPVEFFQAFAQGVEAIPDS
jgi:hypothetical protein